MKVTGGAMLSAPVEAVWAALHDPGLLARAIPGCERFDVTGPGKCLLMITTTLAGVSGTYTGDLRVAEQQEPGFLSLSGSAAGGTGTVSADVTVRLASAVDGGTLASYEVDAVVGGAIAGVGQRMIAAIAKRLAGDFLAAVEGLLTEADAAGGGRDGELAGAGAGLVAGAWQDGGQAGAGAGLAAGGGRDGGRPGAAVGLAASDRLAAWAAVRAGLLAGGAVGLTGILIGAILGRRGRVAGRASR